MALKPRPKKSEQKQAPKAVEDAFIAGASPVVNTAKKPLDTGKIQKAIRFDINLLAEIDAEANRRGMSRNSLVAFWCREGLDRVGR